MWTDFATTRSIHARRMDLGLAPYPEATNAANPRTLYGFFVSAGSAHPEAADFDNWVGYISAYSPHPALCWDWLRYLSEHLVQGPGLPARRSLAGQVDLSQDAEKAACLSAMDQQNVHLNLWRDRSRNQALRSKAPTAATPSPG
jgi:hypothetical protein